MYVMGGEKNGYFYDDIWKSTWSFNDLTATSNQCKLNIPACGVGLKCWPSESGTMLATDKSGVYCTACPYNYGTATSSNVSTTIIAFLVVFVIGFVIAASALGYTYYKLRLGGTPSPIPLPTSAQKWWNQGSTGNGDTGAPLVNSSVNSSTANGEGLYQPLRIRDQV